MHGHAKPRHHVTRPSATARPARLLHAFALGAVAWACFTGVAAGQAAETPSPPSPPSLPSLSVDAPFAEPLVVESAATLRARRATSWSAGPAVTYVLLEGDARFAIGAYAFTADTAMARIETERKPGLVIRHCWVYLENARAEHSSISAASGDGPLLVTASTAGRVRLETDSLSTDVGVPSRAIVTDALERFDRRRRRFAAAAADRPGLDAFARRTMQQAEEGRERRQRMLDAEFAERGVTTPDLSTPEQVRRAQPAPVLPTGGVVRFRADRFDFQTLEDGPVEVAVAVLVGDVTVLYQDADRTLNMSLRADRAVVFLEDNALEDAQRGAAPAEAVRGVYLEDHAIATDGQYTVRAPRVYYDAASNRAILLDAVMYSFDVQRQLPLYVRAGVMRQTAAGTFEANDAVFTTSEFGEPHFGIGASQLTVRQVDPADGPERTAFEAKNPTFRVDDKPVFWLPYAAGRTGDIPLRSVRVGVDSDDGPRIETSWDLYALAGKAKPEGVDAEGDLDFLGERGPGIGGRLSYDQPGLRGDAEGYLLPLDSGEDRIADREDVEFDSDTRGFLSARHRQDLTGLWELSLEGSYVSDETFLEEFFDSRAYESKPFETSAYLKWQQNEQAFTALAKVNANDFIPQLPALQAPGSVTDKLPEIAYHGTGTPLLDGRLLWFNETSAGAIRQRFGDDTPADRGFTRSQSRELFGIDRDVSFDTAAENRGLDDDVHFRFDSRQEIAAPFDAGPIRLTPFVAGRITAYEDDFESFSGEDERFRALGIGGLRMETSFWKTYSGVQNDLFDIDGVRHVVTPRAEAFWIESNLDAGDLPVFDPDVESLAEGGGLRLGLLQTWETRRGGPARSRSVKWVQLRTDLVLREDNDFDEDAPVPRYVGYRPEFSRGGDHAYTELLWLVTDSLGLVGEATYSLESDGVALWRVGATYDASPRLSSSFSFTEIEAVPSRVLRLALRYRLTSKYVTGVSQSLDFAENDEQSARTSAFLERELPRWRFRVFGDVDQLDGDFSVGIRLAPSGLGEGSGLTF